MRIVGVEKDSSLVQETAPDATCAKEKALVPLAPLSIGAAKTPTVVPLAPGAITLAQAYLRTQRRQGRVDGRAAAEAALVDIAERIKRGERVVVVCDLDNTWADTRPRTLEALRRFGLEHDIEPLAGLTLEQVGYNARETALNLGYAEADIPQGLHAYWDDFFWRPSSFDLDIPIVPTLDLACRAHALGAEVYCLTGRVKRLADATLAELQGRLGLSFIDADHVLCKPDPIDGKSYSTQAFKAEELLRLAASGCHIAWFMTESPWDIKCLQDSAAVESEVPSLLYLLFDFPLEDRRCTVRPDTPVLAFKPG